MWMYRIFYLTTYNFKIRWHFQWVLTFIWYKWIYLYDTLINIWGVLFLKNYIIKSEHVIAQQEWSFSSTSSQITVVCLYIIYPSDLIVLLDCPQSFYNWQEFFWHSFERPFDIKAIYTWKVTVSLQKKFLEVHLEVNSSNWLHNETYILLQKKCWLMIGYEQTQTVSFY